MINLVYSHPYKLKHPVTAVHVHIICSGGSAMRAWQRAGQVLVTSASLVKDVSLPP